MDIEGEKEKKALKEAIEVLKETRKEVVTQSALLKLDNKLEKIQKLLSVVQV